MPANSRKQTPTKNSLSAREMWLQAVKGRSSYAGANRKGGMSTKKTPNEYWVGTLRRSQGLQNEIAAMDTFGKNGPSSEAVPFLSTSHYLREKAGLEKPSTSRRAANGFEMRAVPGTPVYKTPEEYYDEVLVLRKNISDLDKDCSLLKAKLRRVEEDNLKKEKEIESLMDPTKSGDLRRTLTDRKPDSSAVVHSLKQKIMRLEQQLKEKEGAISSLKTDLKSTNVDEVRLKMEMFYQEIIRLQNTKASTSTQSASSHAPKPKGKEAKESSAKIKALNDTILRMNEKNVRLTAENKSLKEDLEQLLAQVAETKEKKLDYEEMSRKQLASKLAKLETKLEMQQKTAVSADNMSLNSQDTGNATRVRPDTSGKLELEGSVAERLEILDKRETELLDEIKQLKITMKKIKDDRLHFRQKSDEKSKEIKILKKEIADLQAELENLYDSERQPSARRPSSADRRSPALSYRKSSVRDRPPSPKDRAPSPRNRPPSPRDSRQYSARDRPPRARESERRERRLKEIRENHAAKTIQRGWRQHKEELEELALQNQRVEQFRNDRAARKIQNEWIKHQHNKHERELDDAAMLIQSTARGNEARKRQLKRYQEEEDDEELSDAAELIQSAVRGHWGRKKYINTRSRPSSAERESEGYDSDEAALQIQSVLRGHSARKQFINSNSSRPPSARSTSSRNTSQHTRAGSRKKQSSLDSAGEDENNSDELATPRSRNRNFTKQSQLIKQDKRSSASRSRITLDDTDDDDDIQM